LTSPGSENQGEQAYGQWQRLSPVAEELELKRVLLVLPRASEPSTAG